MLLIADNQATLVGAFEEAGWWVAEAGSIKSFWKLTVSQVAHEAYINAPMAPAFWNTQVQTIGFEQTVDGNLDQRHHVRVWSTPYETPDGRQIFVATANQDAQVKWVVTHEINPDIDSERTIVLDSLQAVGAVQAQSLVPFVDSRSAVDDEHRYVTDGQLLIIEIEF
jgi:undecaprenyl-diphosphatase